MFWLLDLVNINIWKLFENINKSVLVYITGTRITRAYRLFLEVLVDLMFLCTDEDWPDTIPEPPKDKPFFYPRFSYVPGT
jgi:hypothetical protein